MKLFFFPMLLGVILSCANATSHEVTNKEHIHQEFTVTPTSKLLVYNLNGSIKVEGYEGTKVIVEIDKTLSAPNNQELEKAQKEVKLGTDQQVDSLTLFTDQPYCTRPNKRHQDVNINYQVHLDYVIKVPTSMNLTLSTINAGVILVENSTGKIKANNINGGITLHKVAAAQEVHTINGDVIIDYTTLPPANASFYSLNGKLDITFPKNLSADCELKTFQGEFFTDFEEVENLPSKITKSVAKNAKGTNYKVDKDQRIRIGKGGNNLKFETFNGNIYLRKKS